MDVVIDLLQIALAVVLLWKGADFFVDSAVRIAKKLQISDLIIGLTLVAVGTSAPEFAVSIGAAFTGRGTMSIGNVIGSNVFNLGLILGSCAAIRGIPTSPSLVRRDGPFLLAVVTTLAVMMSDGGLGRLEGAFLLTALATYLGYQFVRQAEPDTIETQQSSEAWKDALLGISGLAMILVGAHFLVNGSSELARGLGLSEWAISVTIVAAGTSAPELVTSLNAALKGRYGISAGSLIGSDLFNMLGVLGLTAALTPLEVEPATRFSMWMTVGAMALVLIFLRTGWRLTRAEGLTLIGVNFLRWGIDVYNGGG